LIEFNVAAFPSELNRFKKTSFKKTSRRCIQNTDCLAEGRSSSECATENDKLNTPLLSLDRGLFHFRRVAFSATLKAKVGSTLEKAADLRITLNIDGSPITSRTHTHPSQTSRLLTSSLSLGVSVPRATQCIRDV
jgi:hypothetical protein